MGCTETQVTHSPCLLHELQSCLTSNNNIPPVKLPLFLTFTITTTANNTSKNKPAFSTWLSGSETKPGHGPRISWSSKPPPLVKTHRDNEFFEINSPVLTAAEQWRLFYFDAENQNYTAFIFYKYGSSLARHRSTALTIWIYHTSNHTPRNYLWENSEAPTCLLRPNMYSSRKSSLELEDKGDPCKKGLAMSTMLSDR